MYDVIIIGAGPAGLTAAIYVRRAEKKVLVLEGKTYGGQIVSTPDIENYPAEEHISGFDFATKIYNQAKNLGAEIKFEKVTEVIDGEIKQVITDDERYEGKTVIIATGSESRKLGLVNENELIGKGVSYCATCDGAFFKEKPVAVVGGGNTALEDAIYLSGLASKVYLIHRKDKFRGEKAMIKKLEEKENVEFVFNSNVIKLNTTDGKLSNVEVADNNGSLKNLTVSGLFVAVGRVPETKIFENLVELDPAGYIVANENCHTSAEGIFVAGDNRTKDVRQLATAVSDGATAGIEAVKFLEK